MPIVPTGSPAWTRAASFEDYGGHTEKENYLGEGAINPRTDVDATSFVRMTADLAAVVRTAPFMVAFYTAQDTATDPPIVEVVMMMTGTVTTQYIGDDPPAGFPTFERSSDGVVVITFDASYTDEYGISGAFTPQQAFASPRGTGPEFIMARAHASGQTVTVTVVDAADAPVLDKPITVEVF